MRRTWPWLTVIGLLLVLHTLAAAPPAPPAAPPPTVSDDEKLLKAAKINVDGPGLLDYFRQRTATAAQQDHMLALIHQLGDDSFAVRLKATNELAALGPAAVPYLRRHLNEPDEELKERAETLIAGAPGLEERAAQTAAAARLLRQRLPADAAGVLLAFAPDAETDDVEEEVLASLAVLSVHDGKVDAPVVAALKDKQAGRRGAAAVVLGRSGTADLRADLQKLLVDPDPRVRFRAAQGLLAGHDRAAVPALIALMKDGPMDLANRSHELLSTAFGVKARHEPFGEDPTVRLACVKAWTAWAPWVGKTAQLSDADLPPFNPALRARDVARQFFTSLVVGDQNALNRTAGLPFHMQNDNNLYQKPDDLANFFNTNPMGLRNNQLTPVVLGAVPLTKFLAAKPEQDFFARAGLKPPDVLVLQVQQIQPGVVGAPDASQGHLFLIRLTGDQPRVVGVIPMQGGLPIVY